MYTIYRESACFSCTDIWHHFLTILLSYGPRSYWKKKIKNQGFLYCLSLWGATGKTFHWHCWNTAQCSNSNKYQESPKKKKKKSNKFEYTNSPMVRRELSYMPDLCASQQRILCLLKNTLHSHSHYFIQGHYAYAE